MTNEKSFDFNNYLLNHAEELKKFSKDVNILSSSALTQLQRLPISLRRRAASHNIKRLPHRFQKLAKVVASKVVKRCRKYRRRHLNLRDIYLKRQTKNKWLYTHIWHAKRFRMVNKWGWRVPLEPAQKCFRPCTKAMKNGCCAIDLSYFCTFEICGKIDKILKYIRRLMAKESSESLKNRISEGKEVSFEMYKPDSYPFNAICPCKMLRISNDETFGSSVLISFHPSVREEVVSALCTILSTSEIHPYVWSNNSRKIILRDRSGEFGRFRLLGHLSQNIMWAIVNEELKNFFSLPINSVPRELVIETTINNVQAKRASLKQTDIPVCPRNNSKAAQIPNRELGASIFQSNSEILSAIRNNNLSQLDNLLKIDLQPIRSDDRCPVIMMRNKYLDEKAPGGWDILITSKWAMLIWVRLIEKGCRAVGLRYWARFCALEATSLLSKHDCFPLYSWPDSNQGAIEAKESNEFQISVWKRRPPSKRINYIANGTSEPFICSWKSLLPDSSKQFFVMRDVKFLFRVVNAIFDGSIRPTLADLDDFSADARYSLIPVIIECDSSVAHNNAVVMAADLDDNLSSCLDQNPDQSIIRPIIGFIEVADQCLIVGRGRGFGFVSLYQLVRLCQSHQPVARRIWFKNTNSKHLIAAKLKLSI